MRVFTRRRSLVVAVPMLLALLLGVSGCQQKPPTQPTPIEPVVVPPPPGVSYPSNPSGPLRLKYADGTDSGSWIEIVNIRPIYGAKIIATGVAQCSESGMTCPQFAIKACVEEGAWGGNVHVYLSPNKGEYKYGVLTLTNPPAGGGCSLTSNIWTPDNPWQWGFPNDAVCCRYLEFKQEFYDGKSGPWLSHLVKEVTLNDLFTGYHTS